MNIVGVINWEFAYIAPAQFSFDPPWWLLLTSPNYWCGGHGKYYRWMDEYEPRLKTFLRTLEDEEHKMAAGGTEMPLSQRMRESWENETWMISYAARNSWMFDYIYWMFLDEKFFGYNAVGDYHTRLDLLTKEQVEAMEPLVAMKMEERKEPKITQWDPDDAAAELAKVMI